MQSPYIGDRGASAFARALLRPRPSGDGVERPGAHWMEHLEFHSNSITDDGAVALAEAMGHPMSRIRKLGLTSSSIGPRGAAALVRAVTSRHATQRCNTWDAVSASDHGGNTDTTACTPGVNLALTWSMALEDAGAVAIASELGTAWQHHWGDTHASATVDVDAASEHVTARPTAPGSVSLPPDTAAGAQAALLDLAASLHRPPFASLGLSGCRIGADGAAALGESAATATRSLDLGVNQLDAHGVVALANSIERMHQRVQVRVEQLCAAMAGGEADAEADGAGNATVAPCAGSGRESECVAALQRVAAACPGLRLHSHTLGGADVVHDAAGMSSSHGQPGADQPPLVLLPLQRLWLRGVGVVGAAGRRALAHMTSVTGVEVNGVPAEDWV